MPQWFIKSFSALSSYELYQILKLRINVFILEQECFYPDCDDKDFQADHLFALENDIVIAYTRLLPADVSYPHCTSIGRVVVHKDFRHLKLGKDLMNKSIHFLLEKYPNQVIRISAQEYLLKFYKDLGFIQESETYLEDDIPHIEMAYYPV